MFAHMSTSEITDNSFLKEVTQKTIIEKMLLEEINSIFFSRFIKTI